MKKLILILLTLSLTVGLFVGCSPSDEPADGDNELKLPNEQLPDEDADGTNDQEAPDNTPTDEDADGTNDQEAPDNTPTDEDPDGTNDQEAPDDTPTDEEPDGTNGQEAPDNTSEETPDAPIEREISNKDIEALYYNEIAPKQIKIEYADVGDTGSDGCWYFEEIYSPLYFCRFELLDKFIEFNNVPDATLRQKIGAVEALKIPSIYRFIRDMNIDIETFKAINERNKLRVEQNPNFELGTCIYTDEEIETIYYGTYNEVLEAVKHPLAVVIGNNIYSYNELFLLAQQNKLADVGIAREDFVEHIEKANAKRMDYYIESRYYFTADKLESAAAQLKTRAELGTVTPPAAIEREISNKDFEAFYFSEVAPKQVKIELPNEGAGGGCTGDETTMYWEILYDNGPGSFFLMHAPDLTFEFEPYFDELHKKIGYDMGKVPLTYYMIRALNIDIETFIEINEKNKATLDAWYAGDNGEPGEISYTDEEIDLLYYGTYQDALEMHKYPTAIVVGNSIYSYRDLRVLAQQNKLADTGIAREDFVEHIEKANDKLDSHLRYFTADKLESAAAQLKTRAELGIVTPPAAIEREISNKDFEAFFKNEILPNVKLSNSSFESVDGIVTGYAEEESWNLHKTSSMIFIDDEFMAKYELLEPYDFADYFYDNYNNEQLHYFPELYAYIRYADVSIEAFRENNAINAQINAERKAMGDSDSDLRYIFSEEEINTLYYGGYWDAVHLLYQPNVFISEEAGLIIGIDEMRRLIRDGKLAEAGIPKEDYLAYLEKMEALPTGNNYTVLTVTPEMITAAAQLKTRAELGIVTPPDDTNDGSLPFGVTAEEIEAFYLAEIAPNQIIVKDDSIPEGCCIDCDGGPEYELYDSYKSVETFFGRHRSVEMPYIDYVNECVEKGKLEAVYTLGLYTCVRFLNLDKETFKEINELNRAFLEDPKNAGTQWGVTALTDEEIDIIYEGSYWDNVLWAKHPCAMVVGNSIYSYYELYVLARQNKLADTGIAREDFVEHIEKANDKQNEYYIYIDSSHFFTADKLESAAAQLKTRAELGIVTPPTVTE